MDLTDFEIDYEYLGVTFVIVAILGVFLILDPINAGMDKTPLYARIAAILVMIPIGYLITKGIAEK